MPRPLSVPQIHPALLRALIAASFLLLVLATAFVLIGESEGRAGSDRLLIGWLMAAIGSLLLVGEQNDHRARWFGCFLVFSATGFCYVPLQEHAATTGRLIEALPAHLAIMGIAPYCLWRLAAEFPRGVDRVGVRRTLQFGTITAWLFAWAGLLANLLLWIGFTPLALLDHGPAEGLFQGLSVLLNAVALLVIAFRWLTASKRDQRRAGPFLATLGVLAFMLAAVISASLLRTPVDSTLTAFGAAVVALLPCLVGAIRQRGIHVRMLGARPLLRRGLEWMSWIVLATPILLFWLRWSAGSPALDLQLLFVGSLIAVAIGSRPWNRGPSRRTETETAALLREASHLTSRPQRDQWLDRVRNWSGATSVHLFAVNSQDHGALLDPLPSAGQTLPTLLYLQRAALDLDHLDPLEFEQLGSETRSWIAEQQLAVVEPVLAPTDHLLGLLVLGRPVHENAHREETMALLPILAAGLAPALSRQRRHPGPTDEDQIDTVFAAALCPGCESVFSALVDECPHCRKDLLALEQSFLTADNYQLEKRLGRGSWGSVFQARDLLLERPVALKFFHLGGESGAAALLREARALVSLRGPQLTEIYGAEHTDEGLVLITELLEGGVLADRIQPDQPTMEWRDALVLGLELLASLRTLHDRDLLHGDIKPSNIGFDGEGRLKLIDFGMVRALRDGNLPSTPSSNELAESTLLPGGQPGTPIYSPPEAWEGEPVGVAGDLWPLTVLLWELISGEHPFARSGDRLDRLGDRIRRGETNPWPETIPCPPRVAAFFQRALHVDPGRRFVDLPAMERAIENILQAT